MTERERILEKIKRVQALAERGVAGERDSAAATLNRLMNNMELRKMTLQRTAGNGRGSGTKRQ